MKKLYLLVALCLISIYSYCQSFTATLSGNPVSTTGWTYAAGTSYVSGDHFVLTNPTTTQAGYIYYNTPENLSTCAQFTVSFDYQIIAPANGTTVADGIAFWYISNPPNGFTNGQGLGLPNDPNGLLLLFDTYNNDNIANNPLITLLGLNGTSNYVEGSTNGVIGTNLYNQASVDNGSWHHVEVDYSGGTVNVYLDNSTTPSITGSYSVNLSGYFGFSASTGAAYSTQSIKNVVINGNAIPTPPVAASPVVYCQYAAAVPLTATGSNLTWYDSSYTQLPGAPTPNTTIADTTYYYVTQEPGICASLPDTIQVIVHPQPVAPVITGDTTYCFNSTFVPFTVTGDSITWYTAPGGTGSTTAPVISTATAGTYIEYASQTINGCPSALDSIKVVVYPQTPEPTVDGPTTYCYDSVFIPFTVTGQNVLWYTSLTGGTGTTVAPVINTSAPGIYDYYVTQTINGCESDRENVEVTVNSPTPAITITGQQTYCSGEQFQPLTTDGQNVLWYTTPTGGVGDPNAPTVNTSIPGGYVYYASQTLNGCEGPRTPFSIQVFQSVQASAALDTHYGCNGDTVFFNNTSTGANLYVWHFGDNSADTNTSPYHIYTTQDTFDVVLYATNTHCSDTLFDTVMLYHPLDVNFTTSKKIVCQGQPVTFTNTSVYNNTPTWYFGDGSVSNDNSPVHTYTVAGTYNVLLVENNSIPCYDTATIAVSIDSISAINFTASDTIICEGTAIDFKGDYSLIGNTGIIWNFGDGSEKSGNDPISHSFDSLGKKNVTLTAFYRACPDTSITHQITIKPIPVIDLGRDTAICPNSKPVKITGLTTDTTAAWLWNTGDSVPDITITTPGLYYATVTLNGCQNADSIMVRNDCYINMPNAFTPNGDGLNDYFFPRQYLSSGVTKFKMDIYNRWGQLIFETDNIDGRGWDGRMSNEMQPEGVYIYILDVTFKNGEIQHYQGNVTLLK